MDGIPLWVSVLLILIILLGIGFGIPAMFGHGLMETHTIGWGGRQLGIAIASLAAIIYRNQMGYFMAFICAVFKETSDLLELLSVPDPSMGMMVSFIPFISLELISLWYSFKATSK